MPRTAIGMEFQVTKEYLGFNTHLAYLGTMWEEVLRSDTYARGAGSTVARVIDGSLFHGRHTSSPASPIPATTATGPARNSIRPIGTRSAASPGIPAFRRARSPRIGRG